MNDSNPSLHSREFRIKKSEKILALFNAFSATEKVIFLCLVVIALVMALVMAYEASQYFMVTVPTTGGTLTEGEVGTPRTVNPILAYTDVDKDVTALVYAGLMRRDLSGQLVPDLAESYTVSPDGLTYDFILKKGIAFDDGKPITADDVAFTISKTEDANIKSPERADWADVTVKKVSDSEVQFILKVPYAPFLANTTIGILPQHIWANVTDDQFIFSNYNIQPVGDGPYRVKSVAKDGSGVPQSYILVPSSHYSGMKPYISKIVLDFYPDESHAFAALEAGEIDSLAGLDPNEASALASMTSSLQILANPVPRLFGIFFNQNQNPIFADKAVRQALSLSVDRQKIVDTVLNGYGIPIDSPVPLGILTGSSKVSGPDVALGKSTLENDGWKLGTDGIYAKTVKKKTESLAFSITTADSPDLSAAANMVAAEWRSIGAKVTVNVFQYSDLSNAISGRSYDSLLFGQYVGTGLDLYAFWHSSQRNSPGLNIAQYVNISADKALSGAREATNSSAELANLTTFQGIFKQDMPAVFLYSPDLVYAIPGRLMGVDIDSVRIPSDRWNGITGWYIDTDRVWSIFTKIKL
ncbi:MAG: peptide ABC transporter substrate-binding protein [Candidatus Pacebacteria bacterium]|nr:peptide ABC transporter substrate-binding protein [Candidatus Paceibacterota bacterium]